ncbi:MAG: hypothetical protein WA190_02170 [Usitatibacter sp.]
MRLARTIAAAALAALSFAAHAVGNIADVTIFDRATGRELPVYWHEGRAYVVGRPGSEYQVVVKNRRGEDVLAVVSVDGLNAMTGETANARQSGYVLTPWSRVDVRGWRKSMDEIAAFYFTTLGDSYAARTDRPGNVGVIGVALFQRKYVAPPSVTIPLGAGAPPSPPPAEPAMKSRSESPVESRMPAPAQADSLARNYSPPASAPLGTGHGRREESRVRWVEFERASEEPVETIAIYYDSYRNLVAMGVLQQPSPRNPNPFPASFAPDPWR